MLDFMLDSKLKFKLKFKPEFKPEFTLEVVLKSTDTACNASFTVQPIRLLVRHASRSLEQSW